MDNIEFLLRKVQELEKRLAELEKIQRIEHESALRQLDRASLHHKIMEKLLGKT